MSRGGFEPPTQGFSVLCSNQLSYLNIFLLWIHVQKTYKRKYTVLRSPHVHKKSREQFFLTEYHLIFSIDSNDPYFLISILKTISFYGVQIKMTNVSSSHLLLA